MPAPIRHRPLLTPRTHRLVLLVACAAAAIALVIFGRPIIGQVTVSYLDTPSLKPREIDLPFQNGEKEAAVFTVEAAVTLSPFSSARLRIDPDECIESVTVNGGAARDLRGRDDKNRCWPQSYVLEADAGLRSGVNTVRLVLTNENGPHGVDVTPMLSRNGVLAAAGLAWVAAYLGLQLLLGSVSRRTDRPGRSRHLVRLVLPASGVLFIGGQLVNDRGWAALNALPVMFLATALAATALLFYALDIQRPRPLTVRLAPGWAAVSVLAFAAVSAKSLSPYEPVPRFLFTLLGAVSGVLAVTPAFATLHRARRAPGAVAVAALMAAAPLAYDQLRLALWEVFVAPTTHAVAAIVAAAGEAAATGFGTKAWENGDVQDYHGYVTTPTLSVQIGSWCSGFEGLALYLFLLSGSVLLDWKLFAGVKWLWVPFVATVPYLFAVNVLRIAGILLYALWVVERHGRADATRAAIEAFHSNVGWVLYSAAFVPYIVLIYRWGRRRVPAAANG